VYIEGSLRTRKWQDKETGQDRYSTEIRADRMQMLGNREGSGESSRGNEAGGWERSAPPATQSATPATPKPSSGGSDGFGNFDDDIPF